MGSAGAGGTSHYTMVGVCKASVDLSATQDSCSGTDAWFLYLKYGSLYGNVAGGSSAAGAFQPGDRVGLRLDLSARTLTFTKNGSPHGPGHTNVVGPVLPCVEMFYTGEAITLSPRT